MRARTAFSWMVATFFISCVACVPGPATKAPTGPDKPAVPDTSTVTAHILMAEDYRILSHELLAALDHSDPKTRARAARAIGRIGDLTGLPALAEHMTDRSAEVRASIAFALGLLGTPEVYDNLERLLSDADPEVRAATARALSMIEDSRVVPLIQALLADPDPSVARDACLAAVSRQDPSFAMQSLISHLNSDSQELRFAAAYSLARIGSAGLSAASTTGSSIRVDSSTRKDARIALDPFKAHPNPLVRMQVARALSLPANKRERTTLLELANDPQAVVRIYALRSLAYPGAEPEPIIRGVDDENAMVVQTAIEGLGRRRGTEMAKLLVRILVYEKKIWLQEVAARAMANADPVLAAGVSNGLSKDEAPELRATAARNLAGRLEPFVGPILDRLIQDEDAAVQAAAAFAISDQNGPLEELLGGLADSDEILVKSAVARSAEQRLAGGKWSEADRSEAFGILESLWQRSQKDPYPFVLIDILEAAARRPDNPRATALLEKGAVASDRRVRVRALELIKKAYGRDYPGGPGPTTDRTLEDYLEIVEWASSPRAAVVTVQRPGFAPGRFTINLDTVSTPLTAWNFKELAESGFYDGLPFFRVVPNFLAQTGDPFTQGLGDPGYAIRDEISDKHFVPGTIGMAAASRDSAGSQWFITLTPQPHMYGRYTPFGIVVQNFDGVASRIHLEDRVVSVRVYQGTGAEPLPQL